MNRIIEAALLAILPMPVLSLDVSYVGRLEDMARKQLPHEFYFVSEHEVLFVGRDDVLILDVLSGRHSELSLTRVEPFDDHYVFGVKHPIDGAGVLLCVEFRFPLSREYWRVEGADLTPITAKQYRELGKVRTAEEERSGGFRWSNEIREGYRVTVGRPGQSGGAWRDVAILGPNANQPAVQLSSILQDFEMEAIPFHFDTSSDGRFLLVTGHASSLPGETIHRDGRLHTGLFLFELHYDKD